MQWLNGEVTKVATAIDDLYTYIVAQGLAGNVSWDCGKRRLTDDSRVKDQVVVLTEDGGFTSEMSAPSGIGDAALKDPAVLITVRAGKWDGNTGRAKANDIFSDLHGKRNALIGATTYLRVRAQTPEPIFAGFDEQGRPLHTISFLMMTDA